MKNAILQFETPGLLVSVRNAAEAAVALEGGADIIDVKEPNRGSLGAADAATIAEVVQSVNGRAPVTAALGELVELVSLQKGNDWTRLPTGVSLFKIGLAGCALSGDWRSRWRRAIHSVASTASESEAQPVAVVYADWQAAGAPQPGEVLAAASELECAALLIDTWNKSNGSLFDLWGRECLAGFLAEVRWQNLAVVLAGSLSREDISAAVSLRPNLIAVRGAACEGGRTGTVAAHCVRELKVAIAHVSGLHDGDESLPEFRPRIADTEPRGIAQSTQFVAGRL